MSLAATAAAVVTELDRLGQGFALVGGLAVSVRTEPRFTQDIDLAVAVADDAEAEAITREFVKLGYTAAAVVEHEAVHRLATVRLQAPEGTQMVDLLFASSGIEPEIVADAEPLQVLPGLRLRVARVGHLIALKLLARDDVERPQDVADLRGLAAVADHIEMDVAENAIALIHRRGFDRNRDLAAELAALR